MDPARCGVFFLMGRQTMKYEDIPCDWWKMACYKVRESLACVSSDNRFVWVNDEWCKMLGYGPNELIGKTWMDITRSEDIGEDIQTIAQIKDGTREDYYLEKMYKRKDGSFIPISLYVHKFPEIGDLICFMADVKNLSKETPIQELKEQFKTLEINIIEMKKEIADKKLIKQLSLLIKENWLYITGILGFLGFIIKFLADLIIELFKK